MSRVGRALLSILLLVAAAAADDAVKTWKGRIRELEKRETRFWRGYQRAYMNAIAVFEKPWRDAEVKPKEITNYVNDYSGLHELYETNAAIQRGKTAADLELGKADHERALDTLFKELLTAAKRIDRIEADHLKAKPAERARRFDQRPAIERHGLAIRMRGLSEALARCPNAAEALAGSAMATAARRDGKRSIVRRVALIDALGLRDSPRARFLLEPLLAAPESSLRIAALEALLRYGPEARPAVAPLLADRSPVVRRALLQGIATVAIDDAGWVGPLLESYPQSFGLLRADHVHALAALTNQTFGDAPDEWKSWYETYREEIAGGRFDRKKIEIQEVKPIPVEKTAAFYRIETSSRAFILVLEGSRRIWWPALLETQLTEYKENWHGRHTNWEGRPHKSHHTILEREAGLMLDSLPEFVTFGVVGLFGPFDAQLVDEKKMLRPTRRDLKAARKFVAKLPGHGWCSQYSGLLTAARLAGLGPENDANFDDPRADTIFLWDAGGPAGGRYMTPEAAVAAFKRFNRFRRLVVHTIRVCDEGEPAETLMKALAESSGGTYRWMKKPP